VRYRYGGYKVQGYGRGPLGFRQVFTTDQQTNIETVTTYNQAFPLTGTPVSTSSYALSSADTVDVCMPSPDVAACMAYSNPAPTFATVPLLTQTTDFWYWHVRGNTSLSPALTSAAPIALWNAVSQSSNYGLDGALLKTSAVSRTYDNSSLGESYGDLMSSVVSDFSSSTMSQSTLLRQTSVQNVYNDVITGPTAGNGYKATWHLGRLASSSTTVTPWASGTPDSAHRIIRTSDFTYDAATGQLTGETFQSAGTSDQVLKKYHFYDSRGNETETVTCSGTANCSATVPLAASGMTFRLDDANWVQRYSRTDYDSLKIYPTATYAPFSNGGAGAIEYPTLTVLGRDGFGNVTDSLDSHNVEMRNYYGPLGRLYFSATNTGGTSQVIYRWCTGKQPPGVSTTAPCPSSGAPSSAVYRVDTTYAAGGTARAPETWVYYDSLAREVLRVQQGFAANQFIAVKKDYDELGRVAHVSEPYFTNAPTGSTVGAAASGVTIFSTTTQYDKLGRVNLITHPNLSQTSTTYSGLTSTVTLPPNASGIQQTKSETKNLLGQVVTVTDAKGSTLANSYDASGNVLTVTRKNHDSSASITTSMTYDVMGRKTSLVDPDMGTWTYAYDPAGEQVQQYSATTCTKSRFDGQGRVWAKAVYPNTTCTGSSDFGTSRIYDTQMLGELTSASSTDGGVSEIKSPQYDSFGRVKQITTTIGSVSYTDRDTYDQFGRTFQTFFSGAGLPETGELYLYNAQGYPYQTQDGENGLIGQPYHQVLTMDQRGNTASEMRAGNVTLTTTRGYDAAMGWLTSINTNGGAIQNLSYTYDNLGNQKTRADATTGTSISETFGYDSLQRLLTQTGSAPTSWSYDDFGNQTSSGTYGTKGSFCINAGEVTPGPDALSVASGTSNQHCYDGHGNNTRIYNSSGTRLETHTFSADDKLRQTQSSNGFALHTTTWYYGPDRERLQRNDYPNSTGTGTPTLTHCRQMFPCAKLIDR
jgi:YD repeat-containing protein